MTNECRKLILNAYRVILNKTTGQGALLKKYQGDKEYQWKVDQLSESFESALIYDMDKFRININHISYLSTQYQEIIRTHFTRILDDGERKRDSVDTVSHRDDMNKDDNKFGLGGV